MSFFFVCNCRNMFQLPSVKVCYCNQITLNKPKKKEFLKQNALFNHKQCRVSICKPMCSYNKNFNTCNDVDVCK